MKNNQFYTWCEHKKYQDTPLPKKFIKQLLDKLNSNWSIAILTTKLNFGSCPGEYLVETDNVFFTSDDDLVDFLSTMSLTYSISDISEGVLGTTRLTFIETLFGSNIDPDVIQMFVENFNSKNNH